MGFLKERARGARVTRPRRRSLGEPIRGSSLEAKCSAALTGCRAFGYQSGRVDLNHRPPGPEPGALTGLRYAPMRLPRCNLPRVPMPPNWAGVHGWCARLDLLLPKFMPTEHDRQDSRPIGLL